jgi:tRNA(Ile)-lysidine synthase
LTALRRAGVAWREDASNATATFLRNRVRRHVLPRWLKSDTRDILGGIALARERLEEDDNALEAWVDRTKALQGKTLRLDDLAGAPRAVWRRALHRWLLAVKAETDLSRQGFDRLLTITEAARPTRFSLGANAFAVIKGKKLRLQRSR